MTEHRRPSSDEEATRDILASARQLMLDEHLRRRGIRDQRVLAAMASVPRERFVPPDLVPDAYADRALPIGLGQTISQPYIVGLTAQALAPTAGSTVLEVGVGSGYMAAVLSRLANWVVGVEMVPELARSAADVLHELAIDNVTVHEGDGTRGWPADGPYDGIVVSAAAPRVPEPLLAQLAPGGRLLMPLGNEFETQELIKLTRQGEKFVTEALCPCRFVPLVGGERDR